MLASAHQVNYLPYPGFFAKIAVSDIFMIISNVQFEKKSWQNRNRILTQNGVLTLSVPVLSKGKFEQKIKEVKINNDNDWGKKHFLSIKMAYQKSKFYGLYIDFFEDLYKRRWESLYELDLFLINFFINELEIKTPIVYDENYLLERDAGGGMTAKNSFLASICKAVGADTYLSNEGSKAYVDINFLNSQKFNHLYCGYKSPIYTQTKAGFEPNLSVLDMLFNIGAKQSRVLIDDGIYFSQINKELE